MDNKSVAVFIDAENISADYAEKILIEASNYGDVFIKRVFADWSNPQMQSWCNKVKALSLKPEQQFAPVKGKNASDISLIVSVLTSLFEKSIDVFCLCSSDSDFIRVVQELREREKFVVGFGEQKTAPVFVNSFSEFIYLDKKVDVDEKKGTKNQGSMPSDKLQALKEIIEKLIEQNGKAFYGSIGTEMKNKFSDFIPKNYGFKTMSTLIESCLPKLGNYKVVTEKDGTTMCLINEK